MTTLPFTRHTGKAALDDNLRLAAEFRLIASSDCLQSSGLVSALAADTMLEGLWGAAWLRRGHLAPCAREWVKSLELDTDEDPPLSTLIEGPGPLVFYPPPSNRGGYSIWQGGPVRASDNIAAGVFLEELLSRKFDDIDSRIRGAFAHAVLEGKLASLRRSSDGTVPEMSRLALLRLLLLVESGAHTATTSPGRLKNATHKVETYIHQFGEYDEPLSTRDGLDELNDFVVSFFERPEALNELVKRPLRVDLAEALAVVNEIAAGLFTCLLDRGRFREATELVGFLLGTMVDTMRAPLDEHSLAPLAERLTPAWRGKAHLVRQYSAGDYSGSGTSH